MKTKHFWLPLLISSALLLCGCDLFEINNSTSNSNESSSISEGSSSSSEEDVPPSGYQYSIAKPNLKEVIRSSKDEVTYEDLFNIHNKISIELSVSREEMEKIAEDNQLGPKPDMYRLADNFKLTMQNGNNTFAWEIPNVGIRQKGNTSRGPIFIGEEINNQNHFKLKFNETFTDKEIYGETFVDTYGNDDYDKRSFLGLDGLDFKWDKNGDTTHIKEVYTNEFYRGCGIMAQHVGLSTIKMKYGTDKVADFGLCYIYEQIDKSFIKRSLESQTPYIGTSPWEVEKEGSYGVAKKKYGDLYKVTYGNGDGFSNSGGSLLLDTISDNKVGVRTDLYGNDYPAYERKTNKNSTYDDGQLKNIVTLVNQSSATIEQIDEVVDLKYLAMEEAVSYIIGDPDSFRDNYNNYQIYIRRTDGKMIIIPMDKDRALGIGRDWINGLNYIFSEETKDPLHKNSISGNQRNPLLLKTILSSKTSEVKTAYSNCIADIKKSDWVKEETFNSFFEVAKTTYSGLADFSLDGGYDNVTFKEVMDRKNNGGHEKPDLHNKSLYLIGSFNNWGETMNNANANNYRLNGYMDESGWQMIDLSITMKIDENYPLWNQDLDKDQYIEFVVGLYSEETQTVDYNVTAIPSDTDGIAQAFNGDVHEAKRFVLKASVGDVIEFKLNIDTCVYELRKIDNIVSEIVIEDLTFYGWDEHSHYLDTKFVATGNEGEYKSINTLLFEGPAQSGFYEGGKHGRCFNLVKDGNDYLINYCGQAAINTEIEVNGESYLYVSLKTGKAWFELA